MKYQEQTPELFNKEYFKAFIDSRGSLNNMSLYLTNIILSLLLVIPYWLVPKDHGLNSITNPIMLILILSALISISLFLSLTITHLKKKLYQYQNISSIWQVLFSFSLTVNLTLLGIALATYKEESFSYTPIYKLGFIFSIVYLISIIYHSYWLKGQLENGFSPEYKKGNYSSQKKVQSVGSLALISSGTVAARYMATGQANIFGIIISLLFIFVFSRLNLEYIYVMQLKWQDEEYWEKYRPEDERKPSSAFIRIIIEVLILFLLAYIRTDVLSKDSDLIPVLQFLPKVLLIYWFIRVILWGEKKFFEKKNK